MISLFQLMNLDRIPKKSDLASMLKIEFNLRLNKQAQLQDNF